MDSERLLSMDSYMLLSVLNMKLRDEFISLKDLCSSYEINPEEVIDKLRLIGYEYDKTSNQFKAV